MHSKFCAGKFSKSLFKTVWFASVIIEQREYKVSDHNIMRDYVMGNQFFSIITGLSYVNNIKCAVLLERLQDCCVTDYGHWYLHTIVDTNNLEHL